MAPSPDVTWTPFTTRSPNVDPSALLVARAPLLVLLTVAVRLLAGINPVSRFPFETAPHPCAGGAPPSDPARGAGGPSVASGPRPAYPPASPPATGPAPAA